MSGGASDGIATFISHMPLGGLMWRCATAVAMSAAHYRSISSLQPSCSLPLSHGHNHLATVRVEVERTCILATCNPSRAHPFYLGLLAHICVITSWQLLGAVLSSLLAGMHTKGFGSGIRRCRHPLGLPVVACISALRALPCSLGGGRRGKRPDVALFIVASECTITNFESNFFFYTAKLRLGSICKVKRCFSRNLQPCG